MREVYTVSSVQPKPKSKPKTKPGNDTKSTTRGAILDAAWQLLERRGEADVRLEDIARQARVSRQAVYLHFASRGDLVASLIEHIQERLHFKRRLQRIDRAASGVQVLEELVRFSAEYTPLIYPFARALDAVRRHDEVAAAAWDGRMQSRLARAKAVAQRLQADGALAPGVSVAEAADLIWSLTSIETWEQLVMERGWSSRRYARNLKRLLLAAVVAERHG